LSSPRAAGRMMPGAVALALAGISSVGSGGALHMNSG
jgi:hypothetical protein